MRCETPLGTNLGQLRQPQFDTVVQFDKSMENANKFTHTFADDPEIVRVSISQIENCLYLLLRDAQARPAISRFD
jgi:hypothetical protein